MPAPANTGKSGGEKRVFRTTDKCVQAEMKNKVEMVRLHLYKKILDRQQCHNKFVVEKGKRSSIRALGLMRKTSGLSVHGEPPEGPSDRSHEASPYFKSYRPLTEKRLLRWRTKEKMLQRHLEAEEEILPPWEKDPNEDLGETFAKTMRMLGFSVEDDDFMKKRKQNIMKHTGDPGLVGEPVDVFECLRADISDDVAKKGNGKSFPISAWGEKMKRDYIHLVSESSHSPKKRSQSAMPRMQRDHERRTNGLSNGDHEESEIRPVPRIRPHTASAYVRGVRTVVVDDRPKSALGVVRPYAPSSKNISPSESQTSTDFPEVDLDESNDVFDETRATNSEQIMTGEINGVTSPVGQKSSAPYTTSGVNGYKHTRNNNGDSTHSKRDLHRTVSLPEQRRRSGLNRNISSSSDKSVSGDPSRSASESKLSKRDTQFLLHSVLPGQSRKCKVTFSLGGEDKDDEDIIPEANTPQRRPVKSVDQLVKMKKSTKLSDVQFDERELEKISGLGQRADEDMDGLFAKMPTDREKQKRENVLLNKTEKKIALHAASRQMTEKSISQADALDDIMDSDDSDYDENDQDARRMPQWKRELMAEAPPGLFGPKSPAKVVIAMSKSQRRRELDQLVQENLSDVKKLTEKENARRIRARLHMYFTMRKLKDSVAEISGTENEH